MGMGDLAEEANRGLIVATESSQSLPVSLATTFLPGFAFGASKLPGGFNHVAQLSVGSQGATARGFAANGAREITRELSPPTGDAAAAEIVTAFDDDGILQVFQANRAAGFHLQRFQGVGTRHGGGATVPPSKK